MAYWTPKQCCITLLQTGDRSVLQKCDPAKRAELQSLLIQAQQKLQKMSQPTSQYQRLLQQANEEQSQIRRQNQPRPQPLRKSSNEKERVKVVGGCPIRFDEWKPGTAYRSLTVGNGHIASNYDIDPSYRFHDKS